MRVCVCLCVSMYSCALAYVCLDGRVMVLTHQGTLPTETEITSMVSLKISKDAALLILSCNLLHKHETDSNI